MFNAFKKLTGRSEGPNNNGSGLQPAPPPGLTTMSVSLQKKFAKGVHYNMKIILKGDRNVGKSQLFRRLQGFPFLEEYTATEEIQVANITWNYKTSDDIVKVEIWDVVDVANKKKKLPSDKLKLENSNFCDNNKDGSGSNGDPLGGCEIALDANTIDVYKKTNGVILVFDITKNWTYDYVRREIENIPEHIPVLILGNRRDMGHHRAIASDTVTYFIEGLERSSSAEIRYAESSMRNGFGLKFIHKFFNLPYLHLQREALLKQLEVNREETEITLQELDFYADGDEANYDLFIDGLSQKRRQVADAQVSAPKLSLAEAQAVASAKAMRDAKASEAAAVAARLTVKSDPTSISNLSPGDKRRVQGAKNVIAKAGSGNMREELTNNVYKGQATTKSSAKGGVEDFVPEDDIQKISSFLDDGLHQVQESSRTNNPSNGLSYGDSSEEEGGGGVNPMVAAVEDDFDESELHSLAPAIAPVSITTKDSSDEQEEIFDDNDDESIGKSVGSSTGKKLGFQQVFVQAQPLEITSEETKEKKKKSKHHHKKKKSSSKSHHHEVDLEEFLSGGDPVGGNTVDTSAYEAI